MTDPNEPIDPQDAPICDKEHHLLCLMCGAERVWNHVPAELFCPECGDKGYPAVLDHMIDASISKDELRVMTMAASNWAIVLKRDGYDPGGRVAKSILTVIDRLGLYTDTPLTLTQELADLRAANPGSNVTIIDVQTGKPIDE